MLKEIIKDALINDKNAKIIPITFNWDHRYGVSLMNPSIYNDNGILKACVRCVNYTMHHSEKSKYPHWYGPLQYVHPENDVRLATENFLTTFDNDLNIVSTHHINMLNLHEPVWGFHGLEDGRLFRWDNKLYICGVRRDTKEDGQGRMELSEILETKNSVDEISRLRIPSPNDDSSYCEKNWMPIIDTPNRFISWPNPTNIININFDKHIQLEPNQYTGNSSEQIIVESIKPNQDKIPNNSKGNIRGSSHVIPYKNYYLAIGHSVDLWKPYAGEKDSQYYSYLIVWDKNFNLINISDKFKFMNSGIEFCCGMCLDNDGNLLISFSDVDNAAYIFKVNPEWLLNKLFKNEL